MGVLSYKQENTSLTGLSNVERSITIKQSATATATIKQNPYANEWEKINKSIGASIQNATTMFNAVTNVNTIDRNNLITSANNTIAANIVKLQTDNVNLNAASLKASEETGLPIDPVKIANQKYNNVTEAYNNSISLIKEQYSDKLKQKDLDALLTNVSKNYLPLLQKYGKELHKNITSKNVAKLDKVVAANVATSLSNPNMSLKDIINSNKDNIKAYEANGENKDIFKVLSSSITMYYDNKSVINARYNEALQYLKDNKDITPSFSTYLTELTRFKNSIDTREKTERRLLGAKAAKAAKAAIRQQIASLADNIIIPPGRDSKTYISDVLKGKENNGNITKLVSLLHSEGKSYSQIASTIKSASDFNIINNTDILDSYKGNVNNVVNATVKNGLIDRISTGVNKALTNNDLVGLQAMYRANPHIVTEKVTSKLQTQFFNKVSSIKTIEDVQNIVATYKDYLPFIDKNSNMYKISSMLEFGNEGNMQKVIDIVNGNADSDIDTIKLSKTINTELNSITNYGIRREAEKYAKTMLFLNPNIDSDTLKSKVKDSIKAHTLSIDDPNSIFDKDVSFDSETIKRVNPEYFKDAINFVMNKYNISFTGNPYVTYHNGLYVITDSKDPTNIVRIHSKTYKSILNKIKIDNKNKVDVELNKVDKDRIKQEIDNNNFNRFILNGEAQ